MRKLSQILLTLIFALPILFGGMNMLGVFSNASNLPSATSNGGGGGNSLDDPSKGKKTPVNKQEITSYTFKTYEDYFIDYFNLPEEVYTRDAETNAPTIDYTLITRTTANGETKLSYNGNVFYTITSSDLTGKGTQTNPYIVNSTKGFVFLSNYEFSGINLYRKFIELNCDVVLNDEVFNKYGTPNGGDRICYNWRSKWHQAEGAYLSFNGNGYTVFGLYSIESESMTSNFTGALFGLCNVFLIENVNLKNLYINGKNSSRVVGLTRTAYNIRNVNIYSGNIESGSGRTAAYVITIMTIIENCKNYVNIKTSGLDSAGIVANLAGIARNCYNYGNIDFSNSPSKIARIGGITAGIDNNGGNKEKIIEKCYNYGNIYSADCSHIAGIVFWGSGVIRDCYNYGAITARTNSAGIVAYGRNGYDLVISNCQNYGKINVTIQTGYCGEIFGTAGNEITKETNIIIKECSVVSLIGNPIVGGLSANSNCIMQIQNCKLEIKSAKAEKKIYLLFIEKEALSKVFVDGFEISICEDVANKCTLYKEVTEDSGYTILQNLVINNESLNLVFSQSEVQKNLNKPIFNGFIYCSKNENYYRGSNFSGFYFSWKTGKIGLIALDGRGSFQGKIDEEWLLNKGFEKKSL